MTISQALEYSPALEWKEEDLKDGDWVYSPKPVYGSGGQPHQIFQWDSRINYSTDFGDDIKFFKLMPSEQAKIAMFWKRLKSFVGNVQVGDVMSDEEKEMILRVCDNPDLI